MGVGVGKPLPSQLFSLEPKKKVVFVTEEGDFQPFFPNYNSINQEVERKEEETWLTEVKMKRKQEEKLLQLQKQKMQQELYMKTVQRKQEESQRYKKEIMLDQLRKQHEERERQKAMLQEFQQNGNFQTPNSNLFSSNQLRKEEEIRIMRIFATAWSARSPGCCAPAGY